MHSELAPPEAEKVAEILVIEDNPDDLRALAQFIGDLGKVTFATSGEDGLRQIAERMPDLVLLDIELPDIRGPEVFRQLRSAHETVPVVFVTSHSGTTHQIAAMEAGADDFICKPFDPQIIRNCVANQLREKPAETSRDRITQTYSRDHFEQTLPQVWQKQRERAAPLAFALVQVDHYALYKSRFGSLKADACLKQVAATIAGTPHSEGAMVVRFGQDKFALLHSDLDSTRVEFWGEELLDAVDALRIPFADNDAPQVTISAGISLAWPAAHNTAQQLVQGAYTALGRVREAGHHHFSVQPIH